MREFFRVRQNLILIIGLVLMILTVVRMRVKFNSYVKNQIYIDRQYSIALDKIEYLERCNQYNFCLRNDIFSLLPDKDIYILVIGKMCSSCVEGILRTTSKNISLQDRAIVVVDDTLKTDFIIGYNDSYQKNFELTCLPNILPDTLDEILVIFSNPNGLNTILEYNFEEESIYLEYFQKYLASRKTSYLMGNL